MKPKVVIPCDYPAQIQGSPELDRLRSVAEVRLFTDRPGSEDELLDRVREANVILNSRGSVKWTRSRITQLPLLRMIAVCGIGTDSVDLEAARERDIVVCNIPQATAPIVAEHALALMFAVSRRIPSSTQSLTAGKWEVERNVHLGGKTIGVCGLGPIGLHFARMCRSLGMNVIAWTFHPSSERASKAGVEFVDWETLFRESDVVSVHLKLTPDSRGMISSREFGWMKRSAILVNTARGAIVDPHALAQALRSGRLFGAGLDVFDVEPLPPSHELLSLSSVALTPHAADQNPEGMQLLNKGVVDNVLAFLRDECVNRVV